MGTSTSGHMKLRPCQSASEGHIAESPRRTSAHSSCSKPCSETTRSWLCKEEDYEEEERSEGNEEKKTATIYSPNGIGKMKCQRMRRHRQKRVLHCRSRLASITNLQTNRTSVSKAKSKPQRLPKPVRCNTFCAPETFGAVLMHNIGDLLVKLFGGRHRVVTTYGQVQG